MWRPGDPLDAGAFRRALACGLGRAAASAHERGRVSDPEALLAAFVTDPRYDRQVEASRASWLVDIARAAGLARAAEDRACAALGTEGVDASHVCDVLVELAKAGSPTALPPVWRALESPDRDRMLSAAWPLSDDSSNLPQIIRRLAVALEAGALEDDDVGLLLREWLRHHRRPALREAFREAGAAFEVVRAAHRRARAPWLKREPSKPRTSEDVARSIREGGRDRVFVPNNATSADLDALLDLVFEGGDPERIRRGVRAFRAHGLHRFDERVLRVARAADSHLATDAMRALRPIRHASVRALAMESLAIADRVGEAIGLFAANHVPGDAARSAAALAKLESGPDDWHQVQLGLLEVLERQADSDDWNECLLATYESGPCGSCREGIVRYLLESPAADALTAEIRFDANKEVRALASGVPATES